MGLEPYRVRILVTDAGHKNALACVRSLGRKGFIIGCAGFPGKTLSFYSKYCKQRHLITLTKEKGYNFIEQYGEQLLKIVKGFNYDVLIPVGLNSCMAASMYKYELLKYTRLSIVDWETMKVASSKDKIMRLAQQIGINTPKTIYFNNDDYYSMQDLFQEISFPLVLKCSDSGPKSLKYCANQLDFPDCYKTLYMNCRSNIYLQEYIKGPGHGLFALYNNNEPKAIFMHKRIREFPVTGGPSAVAMSYYNDNLLEQGLRLLKYLNWHGPAMVEFKRDMQDGHFKLIELNPKLWGSLDLTIASGVDIPYLLVLQNLGINFDSIMNYNKDVLYRWVFPDEFLNMMADFNIKRMTNFLSIKKDERTNLDFKDPIPVFLQILMGSFKFTTLFLKGELFFPSGNPMDNGF